MRRARERLTVGRSSRLSKNYPNTLRHGVRANYAVISVCLEVVIAAGGEGRGGALTKYSLPPSIFH